MAQKTFFAVKDLDGDGKHYCAVSFESKLAREAFLGVFMANVHGALWPCAIMLPLTALFESELNMRARIALAVTILLTIA